MKHKNILDQVAEMEKRRESTERDNKFVKNLFISLGVIAVAVIVGGGIFIYKYLQPSEAEIAYKAEQKKAYLLNKERYLTCEAFIKAQLNYPSTYKFKSWAIDDIDKGLYVEIYFTAKNAFGAELPQSGQCLEVDSKIILLGIKNR